jgi:methylmalonyl-CoA/ethylmalonyl-CoA epimerase
MEQAQGGLSLGRIRQIAVNVQDVTRATKFYRDVLGLKFLFEYPGLAFFDADGVRLMLARGETPELDHPASVLFYFVSDIVGAHKILEEKGVEVLQTPHMIAQMPDHELWVSDYKDSEGNIFALMSELR